MLHWPAMPVARLLYTLVLLAALPCVPLILLWQSRRNPGYRRHWGERLLGLSAGSSASDAKHPLIWIHAVSVGETRAAQPLVEALLQGDHPPRILLTHTTPTGRTTGEQLYGQRVERAYLPYDWPWAVALFLRQRRPQLGLLMETEVWPNLSAACVARGVPLCVVNGRLSARSQRGYARLAYLSRPAFASLARVVAQTEADAERFRSLGARDVRVAGNLKFDAAPEPELVQRGMTWRADWGRDWGRERAVWLAASTREGEDAAMLDALASMPTDALLIWAPRHPHRVPEIAALLDRAGIRHERRSQTTQPDAQTRVWIGDTLGELAAYIAAADAVFVGGSLVELGGQNLLEPCAQGKPVLVGPHTFNFLQVTEDALDAGAALRVSDGTELGVQLGLLLAEPARRESMGAAAKAFWLQRRGATAATLAALGDLLQF